MRSANDTHPSVPALQLSLLGGVIFRVADERITNIATRKAEALLIYLVCNPQPQPRETLAELLWDDLPAERAAGNLRLALNQLRKSFAPFLDITRQTIALHGWTADEDTPDADLLAAARVLSCYAEFQYMLGALDIAEATLQQSRFILSFQAIEDAPELMFIYRQLGLIAYWRGAYTEALHYLRLTLRMAEEQDDEDKCGDALLAICGVAYAQGDWSYAQTVAQRSLATYQANDDRWGIVHALRFRGMIALAQADVQLARRSYGESLELAQQIGYRIGEALVWDRIGLLELAQLAHAPVTTVSTLYVPPLAPPPIDMQVLEQLGLSDEL